MFARNTVVGIFLYVLADAFDTALGATGAETYGTRC